MNYIFLVLTVFASASLSIMSTLFTRKNASVANVTPFYTIIVAVSAFASWGVIYVTDFSFDAWVLLYSLGYAIFYVMAITGLFGALDTGFVSLTAFIKQLSLITAAVWGFIFWDTPFTLNIGIGFALIVIALYLCFKPQKENEKNVTFKWVFNALLLIVGNGGSMVIQKYQQLHYDGKHGSMLMFFAMGIACIACAIRYIIKGRCRLSELSRVSLVFPIISGMSSAIFNMLIIILLSTTIPESVIFPTAAVGGMLLTSGFSVVCYRERLQARQWVGLIVGAAALVFLNI